jgi:hypothetical protein
MGVAQTHPERYPVATGRRIIDMRSSGRTNVGANNCACARRRHSWSVHTQTHVQSHQSIVRCLGVRLRPKPIYELLRAVADAATAAAAAAGKIERGATARGRAVRIQQQQQQHFSDVTQHHRPGLPLASSI